MDLLAQVYQRAQELLVPLSVHIDLTYRCHQRCVHCYLPEAYRRGEGPGPEMETSQIKGILDQLAEMGTFFLALSGGEIFLRSDLFEILTYARQRNFSLSLATTGSYGLGNEEIRALADLGIERILLSVYSLKAEIHDGITRTPHSLAKVMKVLNRCRDAGILVGLNCLIFGFNYQELEEIKAYGEREGIGLRLDYRLNARWDKQPFPEGVMLSPEALEQVTHSLFEADIPEEAPLSKPNKYACRASVSGFYITPQGLIWPCLDVPWECGDLKNGEAIRQIWNNSAEFNQVRQIQEEFANTEKRICDPDIACQGFTINCNKFGG